MSLRALKNILGDFKILSGLKTNYKKTGLMRIGDLSGEIDPDIISLGFKIETEIKLLGFTLSNCKNIVEIHFTAINPLCTSRLNLYDDIEKFTVKLFSVQFSSGFF